jgi:signal transduction histidine kinase
VFAERAVVEKAISEPPRSNRLRAVIRRSWFCVQFHILGHRNSSGQLSSYAVVPSESLGRQDARDAWPSFDDARQLAELERSASTGRWVLDLSAHTMCWSLEMHRIFATDPGSFEPTCTAVMKRVHPADLDAVRVQASAWRERPAPFAFAHRAILGDGEVRQLEVRGRVELDRDEQPVRVLGTTSDVTERLLTERALDSSRAQVKQLNVQREHLLEDLAQAEEHERSRIAGEIHDETVQALSAVSLQLDGIGRDVHEENVRQALLAAGKSIRDTTRHLRVLIFELMPPPDCSDLRASVASYCSQLFADGRIACEVSGDPGALTPPRAQLAYRLVQEAMRNAAKHSQAQRVRVSFQSGERAVSIRVSDDGIGLELPRKQGTPLHAGLTLLRRRAEEAGGAVTVGAGLGGKGFSVEIELPREDRLR